MPAVIANDKCGQPPCVPPTFAALQTAGPSRALRVRQPGLLRFTKNEAGGKPSRLPSPSGSASRSIPSAGSPASLASSSRNCARAVAWILPPEIPQCCARLCGAKPCCAHQLAGSWQCKMERGLRPDFERECGSLAQSMLQQDNGLVPEGPCK